MVIIFPKGRTKQLHLPARQLFHICVAFLQLLCDFLRRNLAHVGMGCGMVAQIMPLCRNFFDLLRILFHPIAAKEKGRLYVIFLQNLQQPIRIIGTPSRIKADGNLWLIGLHAINRQPSFPLRNSSFGSRRHARQGRCQNQHPKHTANHPPSCDLYPFPKPHKIPPGCHL